MAQIHDILVRPIITEKSTFAQDGGTYVFEVGMSANKLQVKDAVERFFGVHVEQVRTIVVRGKNKRFGRHLGRRSDWKKAYVTLAAGDTLSFFKDKEGDQA